MNKWAQSDMRIFSVNKRVVREDRDLCGLRTKVSDTIYLRVKE